MEREEPTGENHGSESMGGNGQGSGNNQPTPPDINPEHLTSGQGTAGKSAGKEQSAEDNSTQNPKK